MHKLQHIQTIFYMKEVWAKKQSETMLIGEFTDGVIYPAAANINLLQRPVTVHHSYIL